MQSENWVKKNTKYCPNCNSSVRQVSKPKEFYALNVKTNNFALTVQNLGSIIAIITVETVTVETSGNLSAKDKKLENSKLRIKIQTNT